LTEFTIDSTGQEQTMPYNKWQLAVGVFFVWALISTACAMDTPAFRSDQSNYSIYYTGANQPAFQALLDEFGMTAADISQFGTGPFPINYFMDELDWDPVSTQNPTVYRHEVEAVVRGFIATCERTNTRTLYAFYGNFDDILKRKRDGFSLFNKTPLPLVMGVLYALEPGVDRVQQEQKLIQITRYDLGDSGSFDWKKVAQSCIDEQGLK
jgi:hypothetical protein